MATLITAAGARGVTAIGGVVTTTGVGVTAIC